MEWAQIALNSFCALDVENKISIATFVIAFVGLVGGCIWAIYTHRSNRKSQHRQDERQHLLPLIDSLRKTLPPLRTAIEGAHEEPRALTEFSNILRQHETTTAYALLPESLHSLLDSCSRSLECFAREYHRVSAGLANYFDNMRDPCGNNEGLQEFLVTKLVCLDEDDIPKRRVAVNFPKRYCFSQAKCEPNQLIEIWQMGHKDFEASRFVEARRAAIEDLSKLDKELQSLQRK